MITHRPGHQTPPVDPAVPPLDDELEDMLAVLGGSVGLDMLADALRYIALERHDVKATKTNLLCLAGAEPNVVDLIAGIVARLGDAASNPALRELGDAQQAGVRELTSDYARLTDEAQLKALISETAPVIDGDETAPANWVCWFCAAENSPSARTCGFCHHRPEDGPNTT
ncbi:hypothetical protein [Streptomyces himastatinicus]|uniref:hypothetical protein n=1 Tax=Streptomyces himastatinicus TaxID=998084 RepID=UPI0001B4F4CD|nr:hypothetical protein [Streptomyces himastatinicus]